MIDPIFPAGKLAYTVGSYSFIIDFDVLGKIAVSLNGEVIVISNYQVVEANSLSRDEAFVVQRHEEELPDLPYFFEGNRPWEAT